MLLYIDSISCSIGERSWWHLCVQFQLNNVSSPLFLSRPVSCDSFHKQYLKHFYRPTKTLWPRPNYPLNVCGKGSMRVTGDRPLRMLHWNTITTQTSLVTFILILKYHPKKFEVTLRCEILCSLRFCVSKNCLPQTSQRCCLFLPWILPWLLSDDLELNWQN